MVKDDSSINALGCADERFAYLLESSIKSIPFNVIISVLLAADLNYNLVPIHVVFGWLGVIFVLSILRIVFSRYALRSKYYLTDSKSALVIFVILTACMGAAWGCSYVLFPSHLNNVHEVVIILVLGGMAAGSITSLSIYMSAYMAYVIPMFIPVIVQNYAAMDVDRGILATMFTMFVVMVLTIAKINSRLQRETIRLTHEKDKILDELKETNHELQRSIREMQIISITDPLTGLFNRRYFDKKMKDEFFRAKRNQYSIVMMIIDIDNFKSINDEYGHQYGDQFLMDFSTHLHASVKRAGDCVFRLGGDEFAVILHDINLEKAKAFAQTLSVNFKKTHPHEHVTLSIGMVGIDPKYTGDIDQAVLLADQLLYRVKKEGKDHIQGMPMHAA